MEKIGGNAEQRAPAEKTAYRIKLEILMRGSEQRETDWAEKLAFLRPGSAIPAEERKTKIEDLSDIKLEALTELIDENIPKIEKIVRELAQKRGCAAWIGNWGAGERPSGYVSLSKKMQSLLPTKEERAAFFREAGIDLGRYNDVLRKAKLGLLAKNEMEELLSINAEVNARLDILGKPKKNVRD